MQFNITSLFKEAFLEGYHIRNDIYLSQILLC